MRFWNSIRSKHNAIERKYSGPISYVFAVKGINFARSGISRGESEPGYWWSESFDRTLMDDVNADEASLIEFVNDPPEFGVVMGRGLRNPRYEARLKPNGSIAFLSKQDPSLLVFTSPFANAFQGVSFLEMARRDDVEFLGFGTTANEHFASCLELKLRGIGATGNPDTKTTDYSLFFDPEFGLCRGSFSAAGEGRQANWLFLQVIDLRSDRFLVVIESKTNDQEGDQPTVLKTRALAQCSLEDGLDRYCCYLAHDGLLEPDDEATGSDWNLWWTLLCVVAARPESSCWPWSSMGEENEQFSNNGNVDGLELESARNGPSIHCRHATARHGADVPGEFFATKPGFSP